MNTFLKIGWTWKSFNPSLVTSDIRFRVRSDWADSGWSAGDSHHLAEDQTQQCLEIRQAGVWQTVRWDVYFSPLESPRKHTSFENGMALPAFDNHPCLIQETGASRFWKSPLRHLLSKMEENGHFYVRLVFKSVVKTNLIRHQLWIGHKNQLISLLHQHCHQMTKSAGSGPAYGKPMKQLDEPRSCDPTGAVRSGGRVGGQKKAQLVIWNWFLW